MRFEWGDWYHHLSMLFLHFYIRYIYVRIPRADQRKDVFFYVILELGPRFCTKAPFSIRLDILRCCNSADWAGTGLMGFLYSTERRARRRRRDRVSNYGMYTEKTLIAAQSTVLATLVGLLKHAHTLQLQYRALVMIVREVFSYRVTITESLAI